MWTRVPSGATDDLVTRFSPDREEEGRILFSGSFNRVHVSHSHRLENRQLDESKPVILGISISEDPHLDNGLQDPARSTNAPIRGEGCCGAKTSNFNISTPGSLKIHNYRHPPSQEPHKFSGCVKVEGNLLDDMPVAIANASTTARDLDFWSAPKKRNLMNPAEGHGAQPRFDSLLKLEALTPEACENSDLTAEQHMADLDSSKSSPEDIQSAADIPAGLASSEEAKQCPLDQWLQLSLGNGSKPAGAPDEYSTRNTEILRTESVDGDDPTEEQEGMKKHVQPSGSLVDFFELEDGFKHNGAPGAGLVTEVHPSTDDSPYAVGNPEHLIKSTPGPIFQQVGRDLDGCLSNSVPIFPLPERYPPNSSTSTDFQWNSVRSLHPVRFQQTDTTSIHAWRGHKSSDAGSSPHWKENFRDLSVVPPWVSHDFSTRIEDPIPKRLKGAFQNWKRPDGLEALTSAQNQLSMQVSQTVDVKQAWHKLLQRVDSVPTQDRRSGHSSSRKMAGKIVRSMPYSDDSQDHFEALQRAIEKFQSDEVLGVNLSKTVHSEDMNLAKVVKANGINKVGRARAHDLAFEEKRSLVTTRGRKEVVAPNHELWFTLESIQSQAGASSSQQLPTTYIRVKDEKMTVSAVKKYLVKKLGLNSENEVEIACKGQSLVSSLSLQLVMDYIWQAPTTSAGKDISDSILKELESEGKARKSADGSVALVKDVVMVLTYVLHHH